MPTDADWLLKVTSTWSSENDGASVRLGPIMLSHGGCLSGHNHSIHTKFELVVLAIIVVNALSMPLRILLGQIIASLWITTLDFRTTNELSDNSNGVSNCVFEVYLLGLLIILHSMRVSSHSLFFALEVA